MIDFPVFPISPILEHYGFEPVEDGRGWHPVKCAFHGETDASASVITTEEQAFNCHACGMRGNAVQLIMKKEDLGYRQALARAEGITGDSGIQVHGQRRQGSSLSGNQGDRQSYSAFKRTWLRGEPDTGAQASDR